MATQEITKSKSSATLNPIQRADELLRQMNVEEKVMQLSALWPFTLIGPDGPIENMLDTQLKNGIGQVSGIGLFGYRTPEAVAKITNAIQHYLVTKTRLGIPAIFHNEAANGVVSAGFTHFPTPIGLAATWDPESVREMADLMRRQMRSVGFHQALAPVMDVARDARWGRVHETFGEDPYLVTALSVAFTRGIQGTDLLKGVIATAKHFLGYANTEAGQNMAATVVSTRELYDVYGRSFEASIRLAGLASVMASYSEYDGVPIHISKKILTDLLRGRMGFTGTVVSDYSGIEWAFTRQRAASNDEEVGVLALEAGMDVELPNIKAYGQVLIQAVKSGKVSESKLDDSVRNVLRDKFALGLFDQPYVPEGRIEVSSLATDGNELSRRLAEESVTLIKNENGLLPLNRDIKKIAVIGPHADSSLVGFPAYTYPAALEQLLGTAKGGKTSMAGVEGGSDLVPPEILAAIKAATEAQLKDVLNVNLEDWVKSTYGALSLTEAIRKLLPSAEVTAVAAAGVVPSQPKDIPSAVATAKDADVVILAVGGRSSWFSNEVTEGEGKDTANIELPTQQVELINAVVDVGKPTVAVIAMGHPYAITKINDKLSAIITAYYGGTYQGVAIANAIFGIANPGGKLPFTLPRHVGQVPIYHGQKNGSGYRRTKIDIHKGYLDIPSTPLFPFGHGLSYTTFDYSPLKLDSTVVDVNGEAKLSLTVSNTGTRQGTEVVQIYIADTATGVTLPAQQLVGFARVELEPGESKKINFVIPMSLLGYTGLSGEFILEPGPMEVSAGSSSSDIRSSASFNVTGKTRIIKGEERAFFSTVKVTA